MGRIGRDRGDAQKGCQPVDGGIKADNIARVAAAGADTFVAGSAIFGTGDYRGVIDTMRGNLAAVTGGAAPRGQAVTA